MNKLRVFRDSLNSGIPARDALARTFGRDAQSRDPDGKFGSGGGGGSAHEAEVASATHHYKQGVSHGLAGKPKEKSNPHYEAGHGYGTARRKEKGL